MCARLVDLLWLMPRLFGAQRQERVRSGQSRNQWTGPYQIVEVRAGRQSGHLARKLQWRLEVPDFIREKLGMLLIELFSFSFKPVSGYVT
jgi:hypothetical protein